MTALDINTIVNWSRAVDRLTAEHEAHKRNIEATGELIERALAKWGGPNA